MNTKKGTYIGLRPNKASKALIVKYLADNPIIPNVGTDAERRLHVTLVFSRQHMRKFSPMGICYYRCQPDGFDIFDERDGANCLVLKLKNEFLLKRHKLLLACYGGTHDFDYIPHLTLSYDVGNLDIDRLKAFKHEIILNEEYSEDMEFEEKHDDATN